MRKKNGNKELLILLQIALTSNYFLFDADFYLPVRRVAMGSLHLCDSLNLR